MKPETSLIETELEQEQKTLLEQVGAMTISTAQEAQAWSDLRGAAKAFITKVEGHFEQHVKRARAAWQGLCDDRSAHVNPVTAAIAAGDAKLKSWQRTEQIKADDARRKQDAEDRKRAEAEKKKEVKALEKAGLTDEAEAVKASPVVVTAEPAPAPAKIEGVKMVDNWQFAILDPKEENFRLFVADCIKAGLFHLLQVNDKTAKDFARATKGQVKFRGARVYNDPYVAGQRSA